jgi:hypothetical protein
MTLENELVQVKFEDEEYEGQRTDGWAVDINDPLLVTAEVEIDLESDVFAKSKTLLVKNGMEGASISILPDTYVAE